MVRGHMVYFRRYLEREVKVLAHDGTFGRLVLPDPRAPLGRLGDRRGVIRSVPGIGTVDQMVGPRIVGRR